MEIFRSFGHFSAYCYVKQNELCLVTNHWGKKNNRRRSHRRNSVIDFALPWDDVNSDQVNLKKAVPISHLAASKFQGPEETGGQYSLS